MFTVQSRSHPRVSVVDPSPSSLSSAGTKLYSSSGRCCQTLNHEAPCRCICPSAYSTYYLPKLRINDGGSQGIHCTGEGMCAQCRCILSRERRQVQGATGSNGFESSTPPPSLLLPSLQSKDMSSPNFTLTYYCIQLFSILTVRPSTSAPEPLFFLPSAQTGGKPKSEVRTLVLEGVTCPCRGMSRAPRNGD